MRLRKRVDDGLLCADRCVDRRSAEALRDLRSATLPDGTRARRDGEREDGEPRFVKVQEGEK